MEKHFQRYFFSFPLNNVYIYNPSHSDRNTKIIKNGSILLSDFEINVSVSKKWNHPYFIFKQNIQVGDCHHP